MKTGILKAGLLASLAFTALTSFASAQEKLLRIGMTAADIPRTHGQPDQGFEGNRFTGIPMYDALTGWDLSSFEKPSVLIPGSPRNGRSMIPTRPSGSSSCARREIP